MLRMAVRSGESLPNIICHINAQLHNDLHGGWFITAWLGVLDVNENTLTGFSAGQAPLIHYIASDDRFELSEADASPFGILADMDIKITDPITLQPGDVFAEMSDFFFEARDSEHQAFGVERVKEVLRKNCTQLIDAVVAALVKKHESFSSSDAEDDRTVIIIKRK